MLQYVGLDDIVLLKFDTLGTLQWAAQTGTSTYDYGYSVDISSDGFIYVTGRSQTNLNGQPYAGGRQLTFSLSLNYYGNYLIRNYRCNLSAIFFFGNTTVDIGVWNFRLGLRLRS